jgi:hypothetical protein
MEFRSALASVMSTSMVVGCVFGLAFAAGSGRGAVGWAANQSYKQYAVLMAILD